MLNFFPIYKYISVDNRWGVSHLEPLKSLLVFVEDIAWKHFQEQKRTIYIIPDVILKHLGCIYCILRINVDIGIHEPKIILKVTRCKGTMSDFLESSSTPSDRWGMLHLEPLNLFDIFSLYIVSGEFP